MSAPKRSPRSPSRWGLGGRGPNRCHGTDAGRRPAARLWSACRPICGFWLAVGPGRGRDPVCPSTLADKIPYIDSLNDLLHTFVRVPAGALRLWRGGSGLSQEVAVIAGLLRAAGRMPRPAGVLINTSPGAVSAISPPLLVEDASVFGGLVLAPQPSDHFLLAGDLRCPAGLAAAQTAALALKPIRHLRSGDKDLTRSAPSTRSMRRIFPSPVAANCRCPCSFVRTSRPLRFSHDAAMRCRICRTGWKPSSSPAQRT